MSTHLEGIVEAGVAAAGDVVAAAGFEDIVMPAETTPLTGGGAVVAVLSGTSDGSVTIAFGDRNALGDDGRLLDGLMTGVVGEIGRLVGGGIHATDAEDAPIPDDAGFASASFTLVTGEDTRVAMALFVQGPVAEALSGGAPQPRVTEATLPDLGHRMAVGAQRDLQMLADVSMTVTIELGRTTVSVRDLLSMAEGSVIELDQAAGAPVDVLVNGTSVARGDVVVVDEELGVRITEVIERQP